MIDLEQTDHAENKQKRGSWPTVMLTVVLLLSALGVAYLFMAGDDSPAGTATEVVEPETQESGAGEPESDTATNLDEPGEPSAELEPAVETPTFLQSDEPIADAAEIILPSVVQIQTGLSGVGSGVIFDSDGLILTAAHVIDGQDTVTVRFEDGEEIEGVVIGGASTTDVGVIQVERTDLPAATLALDETPRVGQLAIAVGSPWGLEGTVTAGIISAVNQAINCGGTGACQAVLQTDAAINPGNSGGALVDRYGRVLGINVSIFSLSGANDGVGFAVPIDQAYNVASRLVAGESLETAYLGVTGSNVESGQAGALITVVEPGTGAAEAGIEIGDLVISIDGVRVQGIADLASQVRAHLPGDEVELVIIRDGEEITVDVTLGELPAG